jgi:hypothetical protein
MREKQMTADNEITHDIASRNILTFLEEGRLVQKTWDDEREGRHVACLLGAAGGFKSTSECPASIMPRWLAECTVTLFDGLAPADVAPVAKHYGALIGKWSVISPAGWDDVLGRWLVRLIDQAIDVVPASAKMQSYWPAIAEASEQCKTAIAAKDKAAADAAARAAYAAAYAAAAAYAYAYDAAAAYDAAYAARAAAYAYDAAAAYAYAAYAAAYAAYADTARTAAYAAYAADTARTADAGRDNQYKKLLELLREAK